MRSSSLLLCPQSIRSALRFSWDLLDLERKGSIGLSELRHFWKVALSFSLCVVSFFWTHSRLLVSLPENVLYSALLSSDSFPVVSQ